MNIPVNEQYNGYTPPFNVRRSIERMIEAVPEKYLVGLSQIVLTNGSGLPRRKRWGKVTRRGRKLRSTGVAGFYHARWQGKPAWIELFVDRILAPGRSWQRLTFLSEPLLARTLYHELGHHIHFEMRTQYKEKEDVADVWRDKLIGRYYRQRLRYLLPLLVPIAKVYRIIKARKKMR